MTNSCLTCAKAEWKKTKAGKLHPSGDGHCHWTLKQILLPKAFYWFGDRQPKPNGGFIERKNPHTECPMFYPKDATK